MLDDGRRCTTHAFNNIRISFFSLYINLLLQLLNTRRVQQQYKLKIKTDDKTRLNFLFDCNFIVGNSSQ